MENLIEVEKVNIKIELASPDAKIPEQGKENDNCYDLTAVSITWDEENGFYEYDTGVAVQPPHGYGFRLYPRSSISKKDLLMCNHTGNIDQDFLATVKVRFKPLNSNPRIYKVNDKVAQLEIYKRREMVFEVVDKLEERGSRGLGGFGHTGN